MTRTSLPGGILQIGTKLSIMPVEQFMRDLPFAVALQQSKNIGSASVGSGQLAGPVLYLQMNDGDTLNDLDACKARTNIRRPDRFR